MSDSQGQSGSDWPTPSVGKSNQPKFLFLITPPNSGSTAIADFLAQHVSIGGLTEGYEGQWLIKGLCASDRWSPSKTCNYDSVRRVWLKTFAELLEAEPRTKYIVEKSPPHMVRHAQIFSRFSRYSVICNNRDPYANISSLGHRYHGFAEDHSRDRARKAANLAGVWVRRSRSIKNIIDRENYPLMTYEQFCADPIVAAKLFGLDADVVEELNAGYSVRVKDYATQGVKNMNPEHIEKLEPEDLREISKVLKSHRGLVEYFGYDIL